MSMREAQLQSLGAGAWVCVQGLGRAVIVQIEVRDLPGRVLVEFLDGTRKFVRPHQIRPLEISA